MCWSMGVSRNVPQYLTEISRREGHQREKREYLIMHFFCADIKKVDVRYYYNSFK